MFTLSMMCINTAYTQYTVFRQAQTDNHKNVKLCKMVLNNPSVELQLEAVSSINILLTYFYYVQ